MYLVKLLPGQVMQYWEQVRECISSALPPHLVDDQNSMLHIQEQLLVGILECWIATDTTTVNTVFGIMTTTVVSDPITRTRNLLVYSVTMTDEYPRELWELALAKMSQYAKAKQCHKIFAYSSNRFIIGLAEALHADVSQHLIVFDLN